MVGTDEQVETAQMVNSWINHGGTKHFLDKLNRSADAALHEYDAAVLADDRDKLLRIAIMRWFVKEEIPRIIEAEMNPPSAPKRWHFWNWFNIRVRGG